MITTEDTRHGAPLTERQVSRSPSIGALIIHALEQEGPCTIETLTAKLPYCSWNQLFMAIDALSREGALLLQLHARAQYLVALATPRTGSYPGGHQLGEWPDHLHLNPGTKEASS
ncbi:MAG: hypothetical protein JSR62_07515 [Nitrospira sp.]|nr:hypothetical protein [Nitrospira sp.]